MSDLPHSAGPAYARARERGGKVPLSTKFFQGIGALPDTYKNFAFGTFLLFFYNQVLGMPAAMASIAIMIALIVDAITDPLVGSYSDGLRSRFGRRHALMYASAIPLGVCLYLVFTPPPGLDETGKFVWLLTFAIGVRLSMTFFLVPWSALFAEFSDDYAERSAIVTFRYLCGWIGGVTFTFCTWTFIFPSSEAFTPGHLNPAGYQLFAAVLAVLVTAAVLLTTYLTRREIPYLLQPVHETRFGIKNALAEVVLALKNRNFVVLVVGLLLAAVLGGTLNALEIYVNTYFWGLLPEDLRWFTLSIIGSMTAFVLIPALQRRFDKKHLLISCMFFLLLNGMLMITLRFLDVLPANGDPLLLKILIGNEVIRIGAATVLGIMFVSMVADSLDAQELATGRRQEGVFSAALSFSAKATSGIGVVMGGLVLDYVLAFPRGAKPADVEGSLVFELGLVAGILIPMFYVIPFLITTRYRITREVHEGIQKALQSRRQIAN